MSKQKVNCAKGTREADLGHAVLSASGSHRWLNCTPSARLELEFENTTSEAAREGTAAHALCEHKLKKFLKKRSKRPVSDYNSDEMEECTDSYAEFVISFNRISFNFISPEISASVISGIIPLITFNKLLLPDPDSPLTN